MSEKKSILPQLGGQVGRNRKGASAQASSSPVSAAPPSPPFLSPYGFTVVIDLTKLQSRFCVPQEATILKWVFKSGYKYAFAMPKEHNRDECPGQFRVEPAPAGRLVVDCSACTPWHYFEELIELHLHTDSSLTHQHIIEEKEKAMEKKPDMCFICQKNAVHADCDAQDRACIDCCRAAETGCNRPPPPMTRVENGMAQVIEGWKGWKGGEPAGEAVLSSR